EHHPLEGGRSHNVGNYADHCGLEATGKRVVPFEPASWAGCVASKPGCACALRAPLPDPRHISDQIPHLERVLGYEDLDIHPGPGCIRHHTPPFSTARRCRLIAGLSP